MQSLRPDCKPCATDACVPISRLADCVAETRADIEATGLIAPIVGHVGDGNFHVSLLIDVNNPHEIEKAESFMARLSERAIKMGGTCTGEHGIGQGKQKYLSAELGENTVEVMRLIKRALDPHNIMNPGKIFSL
ncbi:FAD-linked oxidase C-terminal domain-containing protein [Thiofilum sp.]|uniref:FAD-binding oxidoreductase n=1 Tax=Thiofilum sp. TaxID=2212733 RepID=UPI002600D963|nr:FAD-linked oxidase C-terminal domain-containing protein [Thiofilum sp.]